VSNIHSKAEYIRFLLAKLSPPPPGSTVAFCLSRDTRLWGEVDGETDKVRPSKAKDSALPLQMARSEFWLECAFFYVKRGE